MTYAVELMVSNRFKYSQLTSFLFKGTYTY